MLNQGWKWSQILGWRDLTKNFGYFFTVLNVLTKIAYNFALLRSSFELQHTILINMLFLSLMVYFQKENGLMLRWVQNYLNGKYPKILDFAIPEVSLEWHRHPLPSLISTPGVDILNLLHTRSNILNGVVSLGRRGFRARVRGIYPFLNIYSQGWGNCSMFFSLNIVKSCQFC